MASKAPRVWASRGMTRRRVPRDESRSPASKVAILLAIAALMQAWAGAAVSQTESSKPAVELDRPTAGEPTPLDYVLVYGPEDRMSEWWPGGTLDHRRVTPSEFRDMLRRAHRSFPPSVRSARYEARFENDELVDGHAVMEIDYTEPIETILPLNPCNLAIGRGGWADRDGEAAHLGVGPNGRSELRVNQGGRLEFDWSLRGIRETLGGVGFEIALSPCPSSQILLTVPENRIPVVSVGILSSKESLATGMRDWLIELGGENRVSLRIAPKDDPDGHSQLTELRERLLYSVSPGGLELRANLRFDVLGQPLTRLELLVASELTMVSVHDGDTAVSWEDVPIQGEGEKRVILEPGTPIRGLDRELTLRAVAPTRQDETWRLPRVKVQGVHWRDSVASVLVEPPLRLDDVSSEAGRVLPRESADGIDLQLFSGDARIDVVLGQKWMPPRADYGVVVEVSGGQISGHQTVLFEAAEDEYFQITGEVGRSWVIDSIQADRPDMVADWRTESRGEARKQLIVNLAEPLSSDIPVRLTVSARRLESTGGKSYTSHDMIPVDFETNRPGIALIALHSLEPYQLELSGTEGLVRRKTEELSVQDYQLLPDLSTEMRPSTIYLHDGGDEDLRINVQPRRSLYSAEIGVFVTVSGTQASESYVLQIDPEAVRLEQVVIELLHRPGVPVRWEFSVGAEAHLAADSLDGHQGDGLQLERWVVRLRPSRSEPFEVRAVRAFPVEDETPIGLARLLDAAEQKGRVSIGISGGDQVRVENRSLTPELAAPSVIGDSIAKSTYRYDPIRVPGSGTPPMVLKVDAAPPSLPRAWIWHCQMESHMEWTGQGRHMASYRVESAGAPFVHFLLPPSVTVDLIENVEIDGDRAPLESFQAGNQMGLSVRLRGDRRFHEITIGYRTDGTRWSAVERLTTPIPEPDIPVLKRNWIVWLPPGRQVLDTTGMFDFSSGRLRWPSCVLGPMGRGEGTDPFDPLSVDTWHWSLKSEAAGEQAMASTVASTLPESPAMDFSEFLARGDVAAAWDSFLPTSARVQLLIDVEATREQGVTPGTKVTLPTGVSRGDQAAQILNQMGLALATSGRNVVLTNARKAAAHGERYAGEGAGILWRVTDLAWAGEIERARPEASPFLVSQTVWSELPSQAALPWKTTTRPGYEPRDTVGWTVRQVDLASFADATILVVDRNLLLSCLWGCFLIAAFLTWAVATPFTALAILSTAAFFLGAAYLPDFWAPWLSAGFWGSVVGLILRLVTVRRVRSPGRVVARRSVNGSTAAAGAVLSCLLVTAMGTEADAQVPAVGGQPSSPAMILAPLNKDDKPEYYVPEPFCQELLRRASQIEAEAPEWLLREANYQARLNWQATGEPLTVAEFTVEFTLEILKANEKVAIPLGKTVDDWSLEAAWLDGRRINDYTWGDGEFAFSADPVERCELKLQLQPIPGWGIGEGGFQLSIPPLATSRLKLAIPADAPRIEVPTATGRLVHGPLNLEADLGPVDRLEVKWQPTGRANATRVSELIWLNVTLGGALVDAQFHFDRGRDFRDELEVLHDPRLVLRGYEIEGARLDHVESLDDAGQMQSPNFKGRPLVRQRLSLTEVASSKVIVRGQFVVRDASGVGSLRLPTLRTSGFEVSRRWVAATVGPTLQYEHASLGQVGAIGTDEFVASWMGDVDPPTVAVRLDSDDASFELTTRPKPPRSTATWQMSVGYGLNATQFRYRATVDTTDGYLFQHRLSVPADLVMDDVITAAGEAPLTVRWTRPDSEQVVLFFGVPVSGRHTIELRGHIHAKGERSETLRSIVLRDATNEPGTIDIYRQHEALVTLESVEGMKEFGPPGDIVADERQGRIVTRWGVSGEGPVSATARVEANRPKVVVREQVISLRKGADGWTADVDCRLDVLSGIVDRICMETSEVWPGPYVVSPGLTSESVDPARRELVLKPPIRSQLEFSVSGPLVPIAGRSISVPQVRLKNVEYSEETVRLVVLPVGPIPVIQWDRLGLAPTNVPTRFVAKAPGIAWEAYRVQQDDYLATVRPNPDPAQVCFADIRLGWDRSGECRGVALLDVEAGDRDSCVLRVPRPWQLVAVSSGGVPELPEKTGNETWTIPLGKTSLPQRFEVVFTGRLPLSDHGRTVIDDFPELKDLPILQALWTVAGDGTSEVAGALEPLKREQAAIIRLRNVTALIRRAMDRPGSSLATEESWYRGWFGEWTAVRREAENAVALAERVTRVPAARAEMQGLEGARESMVTQLNASAIWGQIVTSPTWRVDAGILWDHTDQHGMRKHYFSKDGVSPVVLRIESRRANREAAVATSPIMYVTAALLVLMIAWTTGRLHRWPHTYGVVLGLCWWLWLWPSILGLLLVAVSLSAAVRSGWRRPHPSGSAIVRLSPTGRA